MPKTVTFSVWEDSGAIIMARVLGASGAAIVRADISSIAWGFYSSGGVDTGEAGALVVATVVYDTLQTGIPWTLDPVGYNFLHTVPAAAITTAGIYTAEYTFTPASGEVFKVVATANVQATNSD